MMTPNDHGKLAAKTIGVLFTVFGLVTLIDFAIHLQDAKETLSEIGWTNYGSHEEDADQSVSSTFVHDTYYVVTPSVSPFGSAVFTLVGLAFLSFSNLFGRMIGSAPSKQDKSGNQR